VVVAGGLLMMTPLGPTVGMGLISAGIDAGVQKFTTGEVNWGEVAVTGLMGAVGGGLGTVLSKAGPLVARGANAAFEGVSNVASYYAGPGPHSLAGAGVQFGMGAAIGALPGGGAAADAVPSPNQLLGDVTPKPRPFALGLEDHLDRFASEHSALTYKDFPDERWQDVVMRNLEDPDQKVLFNLEDVEVWPGITRAASGRGSATDWELLQVYQREKAGNPYPNLEFWDGQVPAENPFR